MKSFQKKAKRKCYVLGTFVSKKKRFFNIFLFPQNVPFSFYLLLKRFHRVRHFFLGVEIKKIDEIMTIFQMLALYDH